MTKWWLIGAAVFLAVLLIASIVLALTSKEAEFAPGTPEHAVQSLLRSVEADDIETAYAMLSQELQQKCELKNFADGGRYRSGDDRDIRATLRATKTIDDITFVNVEVTQFYGSGPFDSGESSYDRRFALQQEGGEWKFTDYPWPYDYCRESDE
jgi:hypothetical protein